MEDPFFDEVRAFYVAHRTGLLAYAGTLVAEASEAEDLVQAAIYRLLRRGRAPRRLRPFVFRSLRNAAIDGSRRVRSTTQVHEVQTSYLDEAAVEASAELRRCLESLDGRDREIVMLKVIAGLTFREIAKVIRVNENTVATRYRRALARLRRELGEEQ